MQSSYVTPTNSAINFKASGGVNDGKTPNDAEMKVLLNNVHESGVIIFFDKGTYLFQESIELPSDPFIVSDKQNFIANEVTNTDSGKGFFAFFGNDHLEIANNVKGGVTSLPSSDPLPSSLIIDTKSEFYSLDQWPPIGYPQEVNSIQIKAESNADLSIKTDCELGSITTSN